MIHLDVPRKAHQLADDLRYALLRVLSPDWKCAECKQPVDLSRLEVDHVDGRHWEPRRTSRLVRALRYWDEFRAGVRLRAVCRSCNATTGGGRRYGREVKAA